MSSLCWLVLGFVFGALTVCALVCAVGLALDTER